MTVGTTDTLFISSFGFKAVASDSSIKVQSFENGDVTLSASNTRTQKAAYLTGAESNITTWAKVIFSIPSDLKPGKYTLGVEQVTASDTQNVNPINGITSKQVTLTVKDNTPAAEGYTVEVSAENDKINTNEDAQVKLNITHSDDAEKNYAAYSMKVSYDAKVLTYKSFSDTTAKVADDGNGTLTIHRYGDDLNLGEDLTLSFTGKAGGTSEVKFSDVKVDKNENALLNAPLATVTPDTVTIQVTQTYSVKRDTDVVDGEPTAVAGEDYTFTLKNDLNGDYMDVSYTVDGADKGELKADSDGKYTIPKENVTGEIEIIAKGKPYKVTTAGNAASRVELTGGDTATYGENYTFTLNEQTDYVYSVTVTVGGTTVMPTLRIKRPTPSMASRSPETLSSP